MDSPIAIAPTAMQRMAHPEGELATARGKSQTFRDFNYLFSYLESFFDQRLGNVIQFIQ